MFGNIHLSKALHQQQVKKTVKSVILEVSPKWGDLGSFPWSKKLRQWLKFYLCFQRTTYPKIRRATRRPDN